MADNIKKLLEEEQEVDEALDKPIEPASVEVGQGKPASTAKRGEPAREGQEPASVGGPASPAGGEEKPVTPVGEEPEEKAVKAEAKSMKEEVEVEAEETEAGTTAKEPAEEQVSETTAAVSESFAETQDEGGAPQTRTQVSVSESFARAQDSSAKGPAAVSEKGMGGKKLPGHIVLEKSDDPRAKWYVIHTYSGHEARVAENLKQRVQTLGISGQVLEMFIPTQDKIEIRGGKKHSVTEKIFPGYLLVKMILTDPTWLAVRTTPGVTGFVGTGSKPTPLSEAEVATIQKFAAIGAPKFKTKFSVGEAVRIIDGPFADYLGSIGSIDEEKGKLSVLVSIFGRETPVELDFLQVTKI